MARIESFASILSATPVDMREVLRYMGTRDADGELLRVLDECIAETERVLSAKLCYDEFDISISGDEIDILMRGEKLPPFQTDDAKNEFKLEPADGPENAEAAQRPDSAAAPAESEKDDAQTGQEAPEAQGETPAEPEKPANGSFSGRWDSFSAPSDRKDDK